MKSTLASLAFIALFNAGVPALAATPAEEILQIEAEINKAYASNDLPVYFSYYADDFRGIFPDGPVTLNNYRTDWTASVKAGNILVAFTYGDVQVQVSPAGDAAVASYRATARMRYVGKEPVDEHYMETDVFFRRAGVWKLVEVHYSPAAEKQ